MRGFVANVDRDWCESLREAATAFDEVNLWRAGTERFRALKPGEPIFLKLKAPDRAIAGFGFFTHFSLLPLSVAWRLGGRANGVSSRSEMTRRLGMMRARFGMRSARSSDPKVGSIMILDPVFFEESDWVDAPGDFGSNVGQGKLYDLARGEGRRVWNECLARSDRRAGGSTIRDRAGAPTIAVRRLGPLSFHTAVLDAWGRRCAVTGEGSVAALAAARIRDFGDARDWAIDNGILLRADLSELFEAGYITVDDEYRVRVSGEVADERGGPASYAELDGATIRVPTRRIHRPSVEALWWHREERFIGGEERRGSRGTSRESTPGTEAARAR